MAAGAELTSTKIERRQGPPLACAPAAPLHRRRHRCCLPLLCSPPCCRQWACARSASERQRATPGQEVRGGRLASAHGEGIPAL